MFVCNGSESHGIVFHRVQWNGMILIGIIKIVHNSMLQSFPGFLVPVIILGRSKNLLLLLLVVHEIRIARRGSSARL